MSTLSELKKTFIAKKKAGEAEAMKKKNAKRRASKDQQVEESEEDVEMEPKHRNSQQRKIVQKQKPTVHECFLFAISI
jgi:hypothetical protein